MRRTVIAITAATGGIGAAIAGMAVARLTGAWESDMSDANVVAYLVLGTICWGYSTWECYKTVRKEAN